MDNFSFNRDEYLKRINFNGRISDNFEFLKSIHRAQHRTIPFENFDICLGRNINLEPDVLVEKMVKNKRGGYCSELNGLFLLALKSFGFEARTLLGRVHLKGKPTGRGHRVTLVTIEGEKWLVDTGFGVDTPPVPIPLTCDRPVSFEDQTFRLKESSLYGFMLQSKHDTDWKNLYSFDLNHVCAGDIEYGNYFTSTHPRSFFVSSRVAALPVENGMISLFNMELKKRINGKEEKIFLEAGESYIHVLEQEFGIVLDAKYEDLKPLD
ncbi:arylamine N-acetyltransferase [Sinomicrobium pectinilyticum]|uniref:Arylamine N-acetyltransferase n=1 Tax=Sinomicrobium pectinilyticum TaxID=1084421 RepID=A0A3N0ERT4_SINP1|nr:arylamine N-acetyltransferase [Sinomicrobium pectinilyticum]RNL90389.1 arylamine N-acetyltransferase [Sinomicrobium pectinilyticum]